MGYRCLIVDDESLARKLLANYVEKIPELELAGLCSNAFDAKKILSNEEIDILFLDIQMEDLTGLDLLRLLKKQPATILTTAYSEYALEGYELDIVDYLLKPISFQRFYKAVNKAIDSVKPSEDLSNQPSIQQEIISPSSKPNDRAYFFVKVDYKIVKVAYDDVLFIESMREYVRIHTIKQRLTTLQTMSNLEQKLPKETFSRVHRSFMVNIDKIDEINGNQVVIGEHEIPISKSQKEQFLALINRDGLF